MSNNREKDFEYWRQVCIATAQVFLGISAATLFASPSLDLGKISVIILTLGLALLFFVLGWRRY